MKKDVGLITTQKFAIKTVLQKNHWEQIRGALKFWDGNAEDEEKEMNGIAYVSFSNISMTIWTEFLLQEAHLPLMNQ